jgi:hypothetical protein
MNSQSHPGTGALIAMLIAGVGVGLGVADLARGPSREVRDAITIIQLREQIRQFERLKGRQ